MNAAQRYGFRVRHFPHTNAYRSAVRLGGVCTAIAGLIFAPIIGANASIFSLSGLSPDGFPRSHDAEQSAVELSRENPSMSRKKPTRHPDLPGAAVLRVTAGEIINVGPHIQIQANRAEDGRAVLSIRAPRNYCINREPLNPHAQNSDGQGASTPQPSATNTPSSTKIQE